MSNEILYILLPDFAAHEVVYLAQAIASDEYALKEYPKYVNKIVAPHRERVQLLRSFVDGETWFSQCRETYRQRIGTT